MCMSAYDIEHDLWLQSTMFLGDKGKRSLFTIDAVAVDIAQFSAHAQVAWREVCTCFALVGNQCTCFLAGARITYVARHPRPHQQPRAQHGQQIVGVQSLRRRRIGANDRLQASPVGTCESCEIRFWGSGVCCGLSTHANARASDYSKAQVFSNMYFGQRTDNSS